MSDLKPCPFCGGTKIKMYSSYSPDLHGFAHLCEINGEAMVKVESRFFETEEEAVEVWNRGVLNVPDTNVGDTISRQAAIDALTKYPHYYDGKDCVEQNWDDVKTITNLPTAHPQQMRGRWIEEEDYNGDTIYKCSECGNEFVLIDGTPKDNNYFFCPSCGARMDGGEQNEID